MPWGWFFLLFASASVFAQSFKRLGINEGLNHNHVTAVCRSATGFLWIGTADGLHRFDGKSLKLYRGIHLVNQIYEGPDDLLWIRTDQGLQVLDQRKETFYKNSDSLLSAKGFPKGNFLDLIKDRNNRFWLLHSDGGFSRYQNGQIDTYSSGKAAVSFALDPNGAIWMMYADGYIEKIHAESLELQFRKKLLSKADPNYRIFIDRQGSPWIFSANTPNGVSWWPDISTAPKVFALSSPHYPLNNNTVIGVTEDQRGKIWIATDHGGVNLFDPRTQVLTYLMNEEYNDRSLSHNGTSALLCDEEGIVWVGTYKGGLNYYHEQLIQFPVVRNHKIPYEDVNRFVEDREGNLWIGTNGGGLLFYHKASNTYKQFLHNPSQPQSLGSNVIVSLYLDKEDRLWVGTYHGGLNLFQNGKFTRFLNQADDPYSLSNNSVWEIFEDSRGNLWIGTLSGGAQVLDRSSGKFLKVGRDIPGPSAPYICAIMEDRKGRLWFGSATGIEVFDPKTKKVKKYGMADGLRNEYISDFLEDSKGRFWVATRDGLHLFDAESERFKFFDEGLRDHTIHTLLEDQSGKIWMSTAKGVSMLVEKEQWIIRNFDQEDGLQSAAFNENAALKSRSGELLFGGPKGFNIIRSENLYQEGKIPQPKLIDFLLFNRSIGVGEVVNGRVILDKTLPFIKEIFLRHDQNVIGLSISPMYFLHPKRVQMKYILEGFNTEWLDGNNHLVTFTNLNAGEYTFKVITSLDGEQWSAPFTLLKIHVSSPWWKTPWAYAFYFIIISSILLVIRYFEKSKQARLFALQQEREEAKRIKELDLLKTKFFTNVSHEFRTPLSLILTPVEKLVQLETDAHKRMHLDLVYRNARRLLNLVNQLLDFRKIDTRSLVLHAVEGDIIAELKDHVSSFRDLAESKEIQYQIQIPAEPFTCRFDHDKLERIIFNLLSNAFKFTPVGGRVFFESTIDGKYLNVKVGDNGMGIPDDSLQRIFDRYFQDDLLKSVLNQGSGIGLSITKEYVSLMGGEISVESKVGMGSTFNVRIPLDPAPVPTQRIERRGNLGGEKILVVEDNEDFRFYLLDNLREEFALEEARNGEEAWEKVLSYHPDLIVSDINMPGMSGLELCRKIRRDPRTKHIPVILLTAISSDSAQIEGLDSGASDYIIKPFNVELLLTKLRTQLKQKSSLEKAFKKKVSIEVKVPETESSDEKFVRKALELIEANLSNTEFSVEILAENLNVSRVGLYKKIFGLTGMSPSEFIRDIRLKRAAKMLEDTGLTVAEVAYSVGYNNPKAFSKFFKEKWGHNPTDFRKIKS